MNKDNIQFAIILGLFGYIIFLQQCTGYRADSSTTQPKQDTIVTIDTILPPPVIVQLPRQELPRPQIIYIDSSKNVVLSKDVDTTKHSTAKVYKDSLEDENLTLYYHSMVQGELLTNNLDYRLKIPKQITKTIQIPKPYPVPTSALLLTTGIGGNINQFSSLTVGLQFVSNKGWALGYDYDVLGKTHHIKLGIKLFQVKNKRT